MTKEEFAAELDHQVKLVRTEYGFTQETMAKVLGMIRALACQDTKPTYPKTMCGKVWWRFVETVGTYKIQQNIISQHYRALDREDGRVCSAFELEEIHRYLAELEGNG